MALKRRHAAVPRLHAPLLAAALFFVAFPVVAYFLLHGGGLHGFGVSWSTEALAGIADTTLANVAAWKAGAPVNVVRA